MTTKRDIVVTLGATDERILDDAVVRIFGALEGRETVMKVIPVPVRIREDGKRVQQRKVFIDSTDRKIVSKMQELDFQRGVETSVRER